jgi:hypothetical protein
MGSNLYRAIPGDGIDLNCLWEQLPCYRSGAVEYPFKVAYGHSIVSESITILVKLKVGRKNAFQRFQVSVIKGIEHYTIHMQDGGVQLWIMCLLSMDGGLYQQNVTENGD